MLTSKDVMRLTGISRATLNNYIALGVVPRPAVGPVAAPGERARRIGWFEESVVERILDVQRLKGEGVPMAEIARRHGGEPQRSAPAARTVEPTPRSATPRLTLEALAHPAYLVNAAGQLEWRNEAASALLGAAAGSANLDLLRALYDEAEPIARRPIARCEDDIETAGRRWTVLVAFFREGALFAWTPAEDEPALLELLARREQVIRDLLRRRPPLVTQLAVLVADLQDAGQLRAELPPEEYFALVNDVWSVAEPALRRHHGVRGKHRREGVVCYFLPQPDGHYGLNAALCADALRAAMPQLERRWRMRLRHEVRLVLNIGLDEGREWFGSFQSPAHFEFAALGCATEHAARLAAGVQDGAILASRRLLTNLPQAERRRLSWGVRRRDSEGRVWRQAEAFAAAGGAADLVAAEIFEVSPASEART